MARPRSRALLALVLLNASATAGAAGLGPTADGQLVQDALGADGERADPADAGEPAQGAASRAQWPVAVEAGASLVSRKLSYSGGSPGPTLLRGYEGHIGAAFVRAEAFPASALTHRVFLSGIGVFAEYASSAGLVTTAAPEHYRSSYTRLDAGLVWRVRPFGSFQMAFVPAVAWSVQSFETTPSFPGLPDSRLSGITASLRTEVPLNSFASVLAGGSYTRWLRAEDLVGDDFFAAGSAFAVEAETGIGVDLGRVQRSGAAYRPLSLRVLGYYATTRYTLEVGPRPLYRADGASDTQFGGRATAHVRF